MDIFGIPIQAFLGQLLLGLVNGSFYAMLSLGLAVIFGLLGIVNFAHGALYMIGAYVAWIGMPKMSISCRWWLSSRATRRTSCDDEMLRSAQDESLRRRDATLRSGRQRARSARVRSLPERALRLGLRREGVVALDRGHDVVIVPGLL